MEQNNNNDDQLIEAPLLPTAETTSELSQEQLAQVLAHLKTAQPTNFKHRFQGVAGTAKPRVSKYYINGELIAQADFDKLSWEEVHASNNVIRK